MSRYEDTPVLPERSDAPRPGRRAGWGAAGVACLVTAGLLLGFRVAADRYHDPKITYLTQQVDMARDAAAGADVVFVGSSVIYRNVDAGYLNERAAERGCALTFMNLGVPAMSVAEFKLIVDTLGAGEEKPRRIVFHPVLYDGLTRIDSRRAAWSDRFNAIPLALASIGASATSARIASIPAHADDGIRARLAFFRYWALSSLRAGEAAHWLLRDRPAVHYDEITRRHRQDAGFVALEDDPWDKSGRRARFRQELDQWRPLVERARRRSESYYLDPSASALAEPDRRLQERLLEIVRAAGARPVALFPPIISYNPPLVDFYRRQLGDRDVLDFGFGRHPEFADDRLWYDRAHLSREGSRLLSDLLLPAFCPS